MADHSLIEWTDASWPVTVGCDHVSPACDHCYAAQLASTRLRHQPVYAGLAENGRFNGTVRCLPERLDWPLRWRKPRRIFVCSMSDLFHHDVPAEFIAHVFVVMSQTPQHTFQVLTKRHARMRALLNSEHFQSDAHSRALDLVQHLTVEHAWRWPLPNVWLGVSVENQQWADIRIPALLETPAAVRFLSCEPLLGPIDLTPWLTPRRAVTDPDLDAPDGAVVDGMQRVGDRWHRLDRLDWVIVGGESGKDARPMHPDWARSLRDQCSARVPFFFKQWGEWGPAPWSVRVCDPAVGWQGTDDELVAAKRDAEARGATHLLQPWGHLYEPNHKPWSLERDPDGNYSGAIRRWGKHHAGRELDGRTWDEYPDDPGRAG